MFALIRRDGKVGWSDVPAADLGPGEVRIAPRLVGLCRTDLEVASGQLAVTEPRILGHEFVGEVIEAGADSRNCLVGDAVAVDPIIACGECRYCCDGWKNACEERKFLGVDCDGALAESIVVPARNVWVMPIGTDDARAAMLEPVAACLAVLKAPIDPDDDGVISGAGWYSQLTCQILATHGIDRVDQLNDVSEDHEPYDFAIDVEGSGDSVERLLRVLRPGGLLVLRSRPATVISLSSRELLAKEPMIQTVNYGAFQEARRLLVEGDLDIEHLLGTQWATEDFAKALVAADSDNKAKHFLVPPSPGFFHSQSMVRLNDNQGEASQPLS